MASTPELVPDSLSPAVEVPTVKRRYLGKDEKRGLAILFEIAERSEADLDGPYIAAAYAWARAAGCWQSEDGAK
jgi:hypothetical protein